MGKVSDISGTYGESELPNANRNSVPIPAPRIGTRVGRIADVIGTRAQAAAAAGVSPAAFQRYISEDNAPSFEAMARLCAAAGARLEWLATGEEPMLVADKTAPERGSQDARLDLGRLAEALMLIDQALALTRRTASIEARARLAAMAYDVLQEEGSVAAALRRIMSAVETETGGS